MASVDRLRVVLLFAVLCSLVAVVWFGATSVQDYEDAAASVQRGFKRAEESSGTTMETAVPGTEPSILATGKGLSSPHGGHLATIDIAKESSKQIGSSAHSYLLSPRQQNDLEMILNGAYSPLEGFMVRYQYRSVLDRMRLGPEDDATLFPIPVTLAVARSEASRMYLGQTLQLLDSNRRPLASMDVQDKFSPDLLEEARLVYGTDDARKHPGILDATGSSCGHHWPSTGSERTAFTSNKCTLSEDQSSSRWSSQPSAQLLQDVVYVGGRVQSAESPRHFDFQRDRLGPRQVREMAASKGWTGMAAILTRSPLLGPQLSILRHAASLSGGGALVLATGGEPAACSRASTLPYAVRMHCIREALTETGAVLLEPGTIAVPPQDDEPASSSQGATEGPIQSTSAEGESNQISNEGDASRKEPRSSLGPLTSGQQGRLTRGAAGLQPNASEHARRSLAASPPHRDDASSNLGKPLGARPSSFSSHARQGQALEAIVSLLPLAGRAAGPRAALWHMIIMKNFGATHVVVGRNHASCQLGSAASASKRGHDSEQHGFYGHYDAYTTAVAYSGELGLSVIGARKLLWVPRLNSLLPADLVSAREKVEYISESEFREMLALGKPVPPWFCPPGVFKLLREAQPPRYERGTLVLLTDTGDGLGRALATTVESIMTGIVGHKGSHAVVRSPTDHFASSMGHAWGPEWNPVDGCQPAVSRSVFTGTQIAKHGSVVLVASSAGSDAALQHARFTATHAGVGFFHAHVLPLAGNCTGQNSAVTPGLSWYEWPASPDVVLDPSVVSRFRAAASLAGALLSHGWVRSAAGPHPSMQTKQAQETSVLAKAQSSWDKLMEPSSAEGTAPSATGTPERLGVLGNTALNDSTPASFMSDKAVVEQHTKGRNGVEAMSSYAQLDNFQGVWSIAGQPEQYHTGDEVPLLNSFGRPSRAQWISRLCSKQGQFVLSRLGSFDAEVDLLFGAGLHRMAGALKQAAVIADSTRSQSKYPAVIEVPSWTVIGLEGAVLSLEAEISAASEVGGSARSAILRYLRLPQAQNATGGASSVADVFMHAAIQSGQYHRDVDPWHWVGASSGVTGSVPTGSKVVVARGILSFVRRVMRGDDEHSAAIGAIGDIKQSYAASFAPSSCGNKAADQQQAFQLLGPFSSLSPATTWRDQVIGSAQSARSFAWDLQNTSMQIGASSAPAVALVIGARLLPYLDSILLMQPCASAILAQPHSQDRKLVRAVLDARGDLLAASHRRPSSPGSSAAARHLAAGASPFDSRSQTSQVEPHTPARDDEQAAEGAEMSLLEPRVAPAHVPAAGSTREEGPHQAAGGAAGNGDRTQQSGEDAAVSEAKEYIERYRAHQAWLHWRHGSRVRIEETVASTVSALREIVQ